MNPGNRADGRVVVVTGSSGSGKTEWIKRQIKGAPRILAWDVEGEYAGLPGFVVVTDPRELLARLRSATGRARISYVPRAVTMEHFGWWARAAFAWGRMAPCVVIAEETADVTTPAKAPNGWGQLIRRGRKWGIVTYAVTQRPSESDKTAFGNRALLHAGLQEMLPDRKRMALELDIPLAEFSRLGPLEYIERRRGVQGVTRGKLTFPKPKPGPKTQPAPVRNRAAPVAQPSPQKQPTTPDGDGWLLF